MMTKDTTHKPNAQDTSISNDLKNSDYFKRGKVENPKFWSILKGWPSFKGLTVLDIGCGHGSLCVDMVSKGAKKVV